MAETQEAVDTRMRERLDLLRIVLEARGPAGLPWHRDEREYFTGAWRENGVSRNKAIELLNDPLSIFLILHVRGLGLEAILADNDAMGGLRKCLLDGERSVWDALGDYAKVWKPRRNPGPRPKDGKHKRDLILELRAQGLSAGKIARKVYGDSSKINRVTATLSQAKKRASAQSSPK